mmetsp:Transcript_43857/g.74867  ORF Transcript_43857/g.74867 Transcript_43857/m.74867 type:complete len:81 (+) Transcript_43857:1932-2174(+)
MWKDKKGFDTQHHSECIGYEDNTQSFYVPENDEFSNVMYMDFMSQIGVFLFMFESASMLHPALKITVIRVVRVSLHHLCF